MSPCLIERILIRALELQDFASILWELTGFSSKIRAIRNWAVEIVRSFYDLEEHRPRSNISVCEVVRNGFNLWEIHVNGSHSFFWTPNASNSCENLITFKDIPRLDEQVSNSRVRHRINLSVCEVKSPSVQYSPSSMGDIEDASPISDPNYKSVPGPRSSTPLSYHDETRMLRSRSKKGLDSSTKPVPNKTDSATLKRIVSLEEELASLRSQMAAILVAQEKQYSVVQHNADSCYRGVNYATPCQCYRTFSTVLSTPVSGQPPPPPPPPPPLPLISDNFNLKEQIQKNKSAQIKNGKTSTKLHAALPDMAEVLKGLNNVKLRPIERSPGGTPLRKSAPSSQSNEISAILTLALKKRMARMNPDSTIIEADTSEENSFSSVETTPFIRRSLRV